MCLVRFLCTAVAVDDQGGGQRTVIVSMVKGSKDAIIKFITCAEAKSWTKKLWFVQISLHTVANDEDLRKELRLSMFCVRRSPEGRFRQPEFGVSRFFRDSSCYGSSQPWQSTRDAASVWRIALSRFAEAFSVRGEEVRVRRSHMACCFECDEQGGGHIKPR